MKNTIFMLAFLCTGLCASASVKATAAKPTVGSLITQFTSSLSPDAFNDAWKNGGKKEFTKKTKNNENMPVVGDALSAMVSDYMVDGAFNAGWQKVKTRWIKDAAAANTVKTVSASLLDLQRYVNPSMFTAKWAKIQPMWESGLKALAA